MNKDELLRKYELAKSETYKAIRAEALNFIVRNSCSAISPEKIQGMLILIQEIDSWITDCERELKKRTAGDICFKAGNNYPNAMLGDCYVHCEAGYNDIIIEDISRFENRDNTIVLEKSGDLAGEILAVAKRVGLKPVA